MRTDPRAACANEKENLLWALLHDFVAHPLMAITLYSKPALRFHDYTSQFAWPRHRSQSEPFYVLSRRFRLLEIREVSTGVFSIKHPTVAHALVTNASDLTDAQEKAERWFSELAAEFGGAFNPSALPVVPQPSPETRGGLFR